MERTEGRRVILADGTEWENADAGYADGVLWLYLHGRTMMEVLPAITDPEKMAEIIYEYGEESIIYEGFTDIRAILNREDGCSVGLKKGGEQ